MGETCDDCEHLKGNRECREGPPQMLMIPGGPGGALAVPGRVNMTALTKYRVVPPGFPACDRKKVKVSVISSE